MSSQIQTLCKLFIPKCFTYTQIAFLMRNSPVEEVRPWSPHFCATFLNSSDVLVCLNFCQAFFLLPSWIFNLPYNSTTLIQLLLSTNTFFNTPFASFAKFQEKERKKTKLIKTETTQTHYGNQFTFSVCAPKFGGPWNRVKRTETKMGNISAWNIHVYIC